MRWLVGVAMLVCATGLYAAAEQMEMIYGSIGCQVVPSTSETAAAWISANGATEIFAGIDSGSGAVYTYVDLDGGHEACAAFVRTATSKLKSNNCSVASTTNTCNRGSRDEFEPYHLRFACADERNAQIRTTARLVEMVIGH